MDKEKFHKEIEEKGNRFLFNSITDFLKIIDCDSLDWGEMKMMYKDETNGTIYFGWFDEDKVTGALFDEPSIVWSIEINSDIQKEVTFDRI